MAVGDVLRLFVIVAGAYMFLKAILSLAKRKMTEPFCLAWAVLSALMILSGILLNPSQLDGYISTQVSILKRRNQELAMQISLVNNDCEKILRELEKLKREK